MKNTSPFDNAPSTTLAFETAANTASNVSPANPLPTAVSSLPALSAVPCAANGTTPLVGAGAGAIGDYLDSLLIIPITTSPGKVQIKDGTGTAIDIFMGGASSVGTLHSFSIPLGLTSKLGAWSVISADANVKAVAVGRFS